MRRAGLTILLGLAIAVSAAVPAGATTVTIGQVAPQGTSGLCFECSFFQSQTDVTTPSYVVPSGKWTVTSWSIMSGIATTGMDRVRFWRPEGALDRLVAESNFESVVQVAGGTKRTFTTSLPVQGGDLLGVTTGNPSGDVAGVYNTTHANDVLTNVGGSPGPALGQTAGPGGDFVSGPTTMRLVNVEATLFQPDPQPSPSKACKKKKAKKRAVPAKHKKKCKKKRAKR